MLHRGYEAWITDAHERRITEYRTEVDSADNKGRTITCFIPSESGKRFTVHWQDLGDSGHHFSARTYVDGVRVPGKICGPGQDGSRMGVRTTADTYRPFQFADLQTTDNDDTAAATLNGLGTIELRVCHIRPETRAKPFRPALFAGVGAVHERTKKAGAHCVTLGDPVKRGGRERGQRSCKLLNRKDGPYVTFVFRYRPAALLQADAIMPLHVPKQERKTRAGPSSALGGVKEEPTSSGGRAGQSRQEPEVQDVIELSDDEDDWKLTLSKQHKQPHVSPVKRETTLKRVKYDPDDVIDLT